MNTTSEDNCLDPSRRSELLTIYRDGLLNDTLPFWLDRCLDREHGGYMTALDRDGTLLDTDKSVWVQGRFAWLLSTLYSQVEPRKEWLEAARLGIDFIEQHCFDTDGRMFFQVTREGQALRKRRYVFSEMFAAIAYGAYSKAAGDERLAAEAKRLFLATTDLLLSPDALEPKVNPATRPSLGFGVPMILINTAQVLREALDDNSFTKWIDWSIDRIRQFHLNYEYQAVMELVAPEGRLIDHFDGRTLNPGHAIEGAWFILREAQLRGGDAELVDLGTTILDWMWRWGWDDQYGGILYFRDVKNLPVQEYWQDMKFWWPQNEAIIATLLAYAVTREKRYAQWHAMIHDWAYQHFPDSQFGEWYGYLHRDGRLSHAAKGTMWKGPFHLPRMQLICWQILESLAEAETATL